MVQLIGWYSSFSNATVMSMGLDLNRKENQLLTPLLDNARIIAVLLMLHCLQIF